MSDLPPTLPAELVPLTFLVGRWEKGPTVEEWVAAGDVLIGITLGDHGEYEVAMVDRVDGVVRYVAQPSGGAPVPFPLAEHDNGLAVFRNPAHDDPQRIRYDFDGRRHLTAAIGPTTGPDEAAWRYTLHPSERVPALEDADRAFAAAVAASGVDGWVAAFDPGGHQWDENANVAVHPGPEMAEYMVGTLGGRLAWTPTHSGLGPAGDLGWTVGDWTWTAPEATDPAQRGAYVTLWRRQADGSWKVWFDAGDAID